MERTRKIGSNIWIKAAILILCFALVFVTVAYLSPGESAAADDQISQKITVSSLTVHRGSEFDVNIDISGNNDGLYALKLSVTFDTDAMTLIGCQSFSPAGNWRSSFLSSNPEVAGGYGAYGATDRPFVLSWINNAKLKGNGTIATLTFAAKSDATPTEEVENEEPYLISVVCDPVNTIVKPGYSQAIPVENGGGKITMLEGVYKVTLLEADGVSEFASLEDNDNPLSPQDVVNYYGGMTPVMQENERYTYSLQSWRLVETANEGNHLTYKPTFSASPKSYDIYFHIGIKKEGATFVTTDVNDELLQSLLGTDYIYDTEKVALSYGTIILFENYMPENSDEYTFLGWYTDASYQNPVNFATMRPADVHLYGYYVYNADPEDLITTEVAMTTAVEDGYLIATLKVNKNFGFNSFRFALDYDEEKLDFVGFYYPSDTALYATLTPTFPAINELIAAGGEVKDSWQLLQSGYEVEDMHFFFLNAASNAYYPDPDTTATGILISFKFALKAQAETSETEIGIEIGSKDLTRFESDGRLYYANATVASAKPKILRVTRPTATALTYTYNGAEQQYTFATVGDAAYYTVTNDTRTAAGTYEGENAVKATLREVNNSIVTWDDGSTAALSFSFTIEKRSIVKPGETTITYSYNTNSQKYTFSTAEQLDYYTIANQSRTAAGTYTGENAVKVTLKDTDNNEWSDGTTGVLSYSFTILKKKITMPTETPEEHPGYVYTGEDISYVFEEAGDTAWFTVTNNVRKNAGTYTGENAVKATLKDTANTEWSDGTTDPLTFPFVIAKKSIAMPTETEQTYVYNKGADIEYVFASAGDSAGYNLANNVRKNAGTYTGENAVKATLKDTANTEWSDGTTDPLTFPFVIAKKSLPSPTVAAKDYNGQLQTATVNVTASDPYEVTENNGGIERGEYDVKFTFKGTNFDNYKWDDSETETVTVKFVIDDIQNAWTVTPYVVPSKQYDGKVIVTSAAAATFGDVVIKYRLQDATDDDYTSTAPSDSGEYYVTFYVAAGDSYNGLFERLSFVIEKVQLTAPTDTTKTYTYTGEAQSYEFANAGDTEQYTVEYSTTDTKAPTNAGTYTVTVRIKDTVNYVWKDGTISEKTFSFQIGKASVAMPTAHAAEQTYVYTGSAQSYAFGSLGDAIRYTLEYNTESKNAPVAAGDYTVTAKLKDSANYYWSDETVGDLTFDFTVDKKTLQVPTAADRRYIYTGSEQTFVFENAGDTDQYTLTGATRTAVGHQDVEVTLKDPANYRWDGDDPARVTYTYSFDIRYAEQTASVDNEYALTVSERGGFPHTSSLSMAKLPVDALDTLALIQGAEQRGALNQLTPDEAAALLADKCLIAELSLNYNAGNGEAAPASPVYNYTLTLPEARTGLVVIRFVGDDVEVFKTTAIGDAGLSFVSNEIGTFYVLADHVYKEVVDDAFLKDAATCDKPAVYWMSCSCGITNEHIGGKTFEAGQPKGHKYHEDGERIPADKIEWIWSKDHLTVTATVHCIYDATHVKIFDATVAVTGEPATATQPGSMIYTATFDYDGETYTETYLEQIPKTEHVYEATPVWEWEEGKDNYLATAQFVSEGGTSVVLKEATVTYVVTSDHKIRYTAKVAFNGREYVDYKEIDRPAAIFLFNYAESEEISESSLMLPGEKIEFIDAPARANATFIGWRDEKTGTLIVKVGEEYLDYYIGFTNIEFVAEWKLFAEVSVRVTDTDNEPIEGAIVTLYDGNEKVKDALSDVEGGVVFSLVPYGNYKLVVEYPFAETVVTRSDDLDVDEAAVNVSLKLPRRKFNTRVDGDGSAEGLDGAISEEEKASILDGTVNKIEITQKRERSVSDMIKAEILRQLRRDDLSGTSKIAEYYNVTMVKTVTVTDINGVEYNLPPEEIKVADQYQTNIFPLTASIRTALADIRGNVDNIFVYKHHEYGRGEVTIYNLPKVSQADGEKAEYECYFIKTVAGVEYIAVRQKEYSVLAFGVSPDPILLVNEITELSVDSRVFGEEAARPVAKARYGEVKFEYSDKENGVYTKDVPTNAGTYYLRAYVLATDTYASAQKIVSFEIRKKSVAIPDADTAKYVYSGAEQIYRVTASEDYIVSGNRATNAGKYAVTVALADPDNMVWESGLNGDLTYDFVIEKKKLSEISGIQFKNKRFTFNGKKHSIKISGELPEGVTVTYKGNNESDLGKFVVTAVFSVDNENYDVSEPMTAVMNIRMNWIPIVILIVIALIILIAVIVIVEKLMKKVKQSETPPPNDGDSKDDKQDAEEGKNND